MQGALAAEVISGRRRGPYRLWTEEELRHLEFHWGVESLASLARRFGRTQEGVATKARELELGRASRGTVSLREFSRISGFSILKIQQAAKALGLKIRGGQRTEPPRRGVRKERMHTLAISEEQQDQLLSYMLVNPHVRKTTGERTVKGAWGMGKKPEACVRCSRNDRPHYAKGRCAPCYNSLFKRKVTE